MARLEWKGDIAIAKTRELTAKRLLMAAMLVVNEARKNLKRKQNRPAKLSPLTPGNNPSVRGEYPAEATSTLVKNVNFEIDKKNLVARVGTNVKYGKWLELKDPARGGRPWLLRTIRESWAMIKAKLES